MLEKIKKLLSLDEPPRFRTYIVEPTNPTHPASYDLRNLNNLCAEIRSLKARVIELEKKRG